MFIVGNSLSNCTVTDDFIETRLIFVCSLLVYTVRCIFLYWPTVFPHPCTYISGEHLKDSLVFDIHMIIIFKQGQFFFLFFNLYEFTPPFIVLASTFSTCWIKVVRVNVLVEFSLTSNYNVGFRVFAHNISIPDNFCHK
jgi:hypothetical protein